MGGTETWEADASYHAHHMYLYMCILTTWMPVLKHCYFVIKRNINEKNCSKFFAFLAIVSLVAQNMNQHKVCTIIIVSLINVRNDLCPMAIG